MSGPSEFLPDDESQEELSLRGLSEAFAQALCRPRRAPDEEPAELDNQAEDFEPDGDDTSAQDEGPEVEDVTQLDACCPVSPRSILEAMLFVGSPSNQPLEALRAAGLMRGVEPEEIPELVNALNRDYAANRCPYHIVSEASGYRLALCDTFTTVRHKFYGRAREARLSQAAIDVLAIVAYKQPLTAEQINGFRGKPSNHLLAQLIRRRLLRLERPKNTPHKPLYRTTDRFLHLFGLESIDDLPESEDIQRR